ncbi:hypothetical protein WR164_14190 [Philodulcilactobacillus myokoensis]|uniref:Uncharacterized protein n=1 Tax=Philodulcilactobacillus myokoensis TaxID=2929573 RepID=A0A9W6B200_9LACO|nr:hypothetical protein WR164_14190 [Philodulcilactobacillus myokoensis]
MIYVNIISNINSSKIIKLNNDCDAFTILSLIFKGNFGIIVCLNLLKNIISSISWSMKKEGNNEIRTFEVNIFHQLIYYFCCEYANYI